VLVGEQITIKIVVCRGDQRYGSLVSCENNVLQWQAVSRLLDYRATVRVRVWVRNRVRVSDMTRDRPRVRNKDGK